MGSRLRGLFADDRRGAALPAALFALIAASAMMAAALESTATETAVSRARHESAREISGIEAAIHEFVAGRATSSGLEDGISTGPNGVRISLGRVSEAVSMQEGSGEVALREIYSVSGATDAHGRGIGALVETVRRVAPIGLGVEAGLTVAGDLSVLDRATVTHTPPESRCDAPTSGVAIVYPAGAEAHISEGVAIGGAVVASEDDGAGTIAAALGSSALDSLADLASIRFGPRFEGPSFVGWPGAASLEETMQWGCPPTLVPGCAAPDSAFFPVIAVDAAGGEVEVSGGYGQGVLIVVGGDLRITGSAKFSGLVLVEGGAVLDGGAQLHGALVVAGRGEPAPDTRIGDNATLRFNRCEVERAAQSLTRQKLNDADQMLETPLYGWYEVVR